MIGRRINDYWVEKLLARGGMGAVYLLRHTRFPNIRKVLKVILSEYAERADIRARFLAEADALSQVGTHPNIVGIDDVVTLEDGQVGMVIPFVEGVPLNEFVRAHGGSLAPHRVIHIVAHIARALNHAHKLKIVHRDLKPENVFVESTDNDPIFCKLLDFGIAKRMEPSEGMPSTTQAGGAIGTPDYMAVEQHERPNDATPASDVYALACLVWRLVSGGLPWGTQENCAVLYRRKLQDPPDPPLKAMPPEWEATLRAALSVDPLVRPSLRQFVKALSSALPAIRPFVPSGVEIVEKIASTLLDESAHDDETVRNLSNRTLTPSWPHREAEPGLSDGRLPPLNVDTGLPPSAPVQTPGPPRSAPTQGVTANDRPRPRSAPALPVVSAASLNAHPTAGKPGPLASMLSTGLISQQYAAQEPSVLGLERARSIVAASEIDLAAGTPGPQPYAHAAVPAVLVSMTQLSAAPSARQSPDRREPPPFVLLPEESRPKSYRKLVALGLAGCAVVAVAGFAVTRRSSGVSAGGVGVGVGSGSTREPGAAADAATMAGAAASEPRLPVADSSAHRQATGPQTLDAGQAAQAAGTNAKPEQTASNPESAPAPAPVKKTDEAHVESRTATPTKAPAVVRPTSATTPPTKQRQDTFNPNSAMEGH